MPMPLLLPEELVSALVSSLQRLPEVLLLLSLSCGFSGCENVNGDTELPFVLEDSSGQVEASSSGRNVETEGDSIRLRGSSTSSSDGSVDMPMVFMARIVT